MRSNVGGMLTKLQAVALGCWFFTSVLDSLFSTQTALNWTASNRLKPMRYPRFDSLSPGLPSLEDSLPEWKAVMPNACLRRLACGRQADFVIDGYVDPREPLRLSACAHAQAGDEGPVRQPHRLPHVARAVSRLPRHRHHPPQSDAVYPARDDYAGKNWKQMDDWPGIHKTHGDAPIATGRVNHE